MTLNQLIEELQTYVDCWDLGDTNVTLFSEVNDKYECVYKNIQHITYDKDLNEIHLWRE